MYLVPQGCALKNGCDSKFLYYVYFTTCYKQQIRGSIIVKSTLKKKTKKKLMAMRGIAFPITVGSRAGARQSHGGSKGNFRIKRD